MSEDVPRKLFYKIGEVCQLTDTQPYVLRFWESEFPQLAPKKSRSGQRLYRRKDIDLVLEIKKLLYQEGFTIAGARKKLGMPEGQGSLDDLFEPAETHPPADGRVLSTVADDLHEILRTMDETDRRLGVKHGARKR
ncbi:MAG TPA: MerR family transcriptional regulator [Candidatus Polarisedimenticolia bacterium]|nr:MerR family transcriptional regulator [Candidatus Polarisedimenticolia bacterium]